MAKRKTGKVKHSKRHVVIAHKMFGGGAPLTAAEQKEVAQRGAGFFSSLWDSIKSVGNFVKDNKLISGVAGLLPGPIARGVATGAKLVGLGGVHRSSYAASTGFTG